MEPIRDINQHMLCSADPYRGVLEHTNRKEKIMIYLPVGGEVSFAKETSFTIIRREGHSMLNVYRYNQNDTG